MNEEKGPVLNCHIEEFKDSKWAAFPLLLLLLPMKLIHIYFPLATLVILAFARKHRMKLSGPAGLVGAAMVFTLASTLLRFLSQFESTGRDLIEVFRLLPLLLIFLYYPAWRGLRFRHLVDAALLFVVIDGTISIFQIKGWATSFPLSIISELYNSDIHIQYAGARAIGLAPGPGQHGATLFLIFVILLVGLFSQADRRKRCAIGSLGALCLLLASQSQSSFVASACVCLSVLIYFMIFGDKAARRMAIWIALVVGIVTSQIVIWVSTHLSYLWTLFTKGLQRSSYIGREQKWFAILDHMSEEPYWIIPGWGKEYFLQTSSAMDNEWLYIFAVYGALFWSIVVFLIARYEFTVGSSMMNRSRKPCGISIVLFFLLAGGSILAWPSSFFTQPNTLCLIGLIVAVQQLSERDRVDFRSSH